MTTNRMALGSFNDQRTEAIESLRDIAAWLRDAVEAQPALAFDADDLADRIDAQVRTREPRVRPAAPSTLKTLEKDMCVQALNEANDVIQDAAAILGITRHALKRRIIKHRIEWPRSSPAALPESDAPS